jgi:Tfp pilus assembly protein PilF
MDGNQPDGPSRSRVLFSRGGLELLACTAAALVYLRTLTFGFVYDDVLQVFQNPALHEWRYLPQYFTSHLLAGLYPNAGGNYYRPLVMLWLRLNYVLFGLAPAGWHVTTVFCHVIATYLVFRFAQEVSGERLVAFIAALLFAVHPAHIENVAWISGVSDPLMACLLLGSLLAFFAGRGTSSRSKTVAPTIYSLVLFACALLTKETAVVLPALVFLWVLAESQTTELAQSAMDGVSRATRVSAPYVVVVLVYAAGRFWALHGFSHPVIALSWAHMLLSCPAVLWFYARHLFLPTSVDEFYPLRYVEQATACTLLLPLAMLAMVLVVGWFWIRWLSRTGAVERRASWFAVGLITLPLLPVLDLRSLTVGDIVHDRYLYLPSVGFVLLLALSLRELERRKWSPSFRAVSLIVAGLIAAWFAALTVAQQAQWANDIQLYTRGVESAPDNLTVRDNLANALFAVNQPARAVPVYRDVLQRNPNFWPANYNLGFTYYKMGNYAAAEEFLRRAINLDGADGDQYIYLALAELQLKKFADAGEAAHQAIVRNPQARGYHFVLGLIDESEGDAKAAMAAFRAELMQHPDSAPAAAELQKLQTTAANPRP